MKTALCLLCVLGACAFASLSSSSSFIIASPGEKSSAVFVEKDAEYASVPVTIQSGQRDPADQYSEIKQVHDLIATHARGRAGIDVHSGPIALSAMPAKDGFAISSGYYRGKTSTAQMHILAKFDPGSDIYDCALRIRKFIDSIKLPAKVELELGDIRLAVKDPQQYRADILKKVGEDAAFVKKTLGTNGTVTLSGLDNPVLVRQVDNRKVELFIDYAMTLETAAD